jgi:hypothetical protein
MATQLSGRPFIIGFATVIALVASIGFFTLRNAQDRRFAISIHSIPESAHADLVPLGSPLRVRIDKRSAGRSKLLAFAMLLDGDGRLLAEMSPLEVRTLPNGKPGEDTLFPPLEKLPGQRLLAAIVLRLPPAQVETAKQRVRGVIDKSLLRKPTPSLPGVFGSILTLSRELGGHAELTQVEVREKL